MRVLVRIDCTTQHLDVQPSDTIKDVMDKLHLKFDIPVDEQRLFWSTRRLDAHSSLAEYRIHAEAKLTLMRSVGSTAAKHFSKGRTRARSGSCRPFSTSPVPAEKLVSSGFESVDIQILGVDGSLRCTFPTDPGNSIESIKLLIHERLGVDPSEQKLCCDSEMATMPSDFEMVGRLAKNGRLSLTLVRMNPDHARMLKDVKSGRCLLSNLPCESLEDAVIVLAAVRAGDRSAIKMLLEGRLALTSELALEAVAVDDGIFGKLPECLKADASIALAAVHRNARVLQQVSTDLKGDRDFVMQAVSKNGLSLQHVGTCFRHDRDVVLTAVRNAGGAIRFASDRMKRDREVLLTASANDASILRYLDLDVLNC